MSYLQQRHLRQTAASRQWSSSASLQSQRLSEIRDSSASTSIVYCNSRPRRTFSASAGYGFVATYLQRAFEHNPHPHQDEPQSLGANVAQFGFGPEKACRVEWRQDLIWSRSTLARHRSGWGDIRQDRGRLHCALGAVGWSRCAWSSRNIGPHSPHASTNNCQSTWPRSHSQSGLETTCEQVACGQESQSAYW